MKKLIVLGAGLGAATAASVALFSTGVAGASPNVVGQTLSEAQAAVTAAGLTSVVSTSVGDQQAQSNCVVARQQDRIVPAPQDTALSDSTQVLLFLNCYAAVAGTTAPGYSAASPEGQSYIASASSSSAAAAASSSAAASAAAPSS